MGNSPAQSQANPGYGVQTPNVSNLVGTTGAIMNNNAPLSGGANITDLVRNVGQIRGIGAGAPVGGGGQAARPTTLYQPGITGPQTMQPFTGGGMPQWLQGVAMNLGGGGRSK